MNQILFYFKHNFIGKDINANKKVNKMMKEINMVMQK